MTDRLTNAEVIAKHAACDRKVCRVDAPPGDWLMRLRTTIEPNNPNEDAL